MDRQNGSKWFHENHETVKARMRPKAPFLVLVVRRNAPQRNQHTLGLHSPGESGYGEFRRVEGFSIFVDMERAMAWQPSDNVEDVSF